MCDCAELEDIVNCGDNEQEEFVLPRRLRFLREKRGARLYVCPECTTYWQVDHLERGPQAIKVVDPFRWEQFDDSPFRLKFMERFHGGTGQEQCMHQGCHQHALKGMALCVRHAYPELANTRP
jgi:hypothetical protein